MSSKKNMWFGLAAMVVFVGATIYHNLKKTFDELQYKFTGLKFDFSKSLESGLANLFFSINLVLTNNQATSIKILAVDFDVYYNNNKIATIQQDSGINISPKQTTINVVEINVISQQLPGAISNALQNLVNKKYQFTFTFDGTITTSIGTFPIKQNLNIGS